MIFIYLSIPRCEINFILFLVYVHLIYTVLETKRGAKRSQVKADFDIQKQAHTCMHCQQEAATPTASFVVFFNTSIIMNPLSIVRTIVYCASTIIHYHCQEDHTKVGVESDIWRWGFVVCEKKKNSKHQCLDCCKRNALTCERHWMGQGNNEEEQVVIWFFSPFLV